MLVTLAVLARGELSEPDPRADQAVALLALASAREAQLDEADQKYLKQLQRCREHGEDCSSVVKAFQESKATFRALEDQALAQAKQALTRPAPNPPNPHPLRSHVSKHSKAPSQSEQSSLHRLMFLAFGVSLVVAAFLSGRRPGCHTFRFCSVLSPAYPAFVSHTACLFGKFQHGAGRVAWQLDICSSATIQV